MRATVEESVARLERQLPLHARQRALRPLWRELHRQILHSLVRRGYAPSRQEIAACVGPDDVDAAIAALGAADLAVLSKDRRAIVGAYPVTTEQTPHQLLVDGQAINAMCALDAVAVAPSFGARVEIRSRCRVTGEPVRVVQDGERIVEVQPPGLSVGVRWQPPTGDHAAHSMCTEMVFLKDDEAAARWSGGDRKHHSVYTLAQTVAFGAGAFRPLLQE